ncbi:MAG TPA: bifunctional diguanylate cyclase/phosphodiesterase, partial [Candidatus Deferrimicrobium sp.]|nr:bifunctional diguanylate cyclase/phosphodiesterase [Candidatus Deferrimicrobium sp.]
MRTPRLVTTRRPRVRLWNGSRLIRVRLWLAMLGLAVLPMVGVILLTNALRPEGDSTTAERRAWQTSTAAADLVARVGELETSVLGVAADPELPQLADGVDGAEERQVAARALASLGIGDESLVRGACITRVSDPAGVSLTGSTPALGTPASVSASEAGSGACASAAVTAMALAAPPGAVVRDTRWGSDRSRHLMLSTKLAGPVRREAAVLTAEVSLERLFEAIPSASGAASGAALVDLTTDTVVAGSRTDRVAAGAGGQGARPLGDLRVHINGITSGHAGTVRTLASSGWVSTAVPLWQASDGTQFGLIHVWPVVPAADASLLVAALVAFALVVLVIAVVIARTFLQPFDDLAGSQAQLEVLYREAREDSLHDGLTGLGNHRSFQEELDRQLEIHRRHKVPVSLLLLDLDDLKVVNDAEGHPAGDRLLVGMANSIRDALRYGDRGFRIGGDEFAVIMPHTEAPDALTAANRLRHFCLRPAAGERAIPFSGGISSVPLLAVDRGELFRQADAALYRCKRNGRGTVAVYDADRDQAPDASADQGAIAAIRDVIRARALTPVYQPIVDLRDGRVLGFEGLIRPAPSTPFSNPGQLFEAAAAAGRLVELDLACFEVVTAGTTGIDANQVVTINLSPRTLEVQDFTASWLLQILARHRLSPGRVIVELTEREAITDLDRLRRNVAGLQHAGVRIAADDVGAGNAGLRLLSQLRFDIVKIDLSLVQEGTQRDSSRNVLRSLKDLADRQGAVAIAEGLETAEQLRALRELGIAAGQGYLLGRPGR